MTYYEDEGGGRRVEVVCQIEDNNGDYVKLGPGAVDDSPPAAAEEEPSAPGRRSALWFWVKLVVVILFVGSLAVVVIKWVGPYFIDKVCAFSPHLLLLVLDCVLCVFCCLFFSWKVLIPF